MPKGSTGIGLGDGPRVSVSTNELRAMMTRPDDLCRLKRHWHCCILLVVGWIMTACGHTPINVGLAKNEAVDYYTSGDYQKDFDEVVEAAQAVLERRAREGEKLAIVLDIDETTLSNWTIITANDFGYINLKDLGDCKVYPTAWNCWYVESKAPGFQSMLRLYAAALRENIAVFFVSGRAEKFREATEANLRAAGYPEWKKVFLKSDNDSKNVCFYKRDKRKEITEGGWTIVMNIGDQESDHFGGYWERKVLLPNPFYHIPCIR